MKKYFLIIFLIAYLIISIIFKPIIPCMFHTITGLYCPGCGVSRMIISIFKFDFYQAFRYNPLLFIMLPFFIILIVNYVYSIMLKKVPLYKKINNKVWILFVIILVLYAIIRNIYLPLSPTVIST